MKKIFSGINELYEGLAVKKWVKIIPGNNTLFNDYNRKRYFIPVADIVLDNDVFKSGRKRRNTLIKFTPKISVKDWRKTSEWLYLFVLDDRIVKIGGTRVGLKQRTASYLTGHHVRERGKSGDCSNTNGFIYNTFEFYLNLGYEIQMYGYELPGVDVTVEILDKENIIPVQTYHVYESVFMEEYKTIYGKFPTLSDNCAPGYKLATM